MGPLVATDWLAHRLGAVKIIDASWRLPGQGDAREEYVRRHIPGAVFFDIDAVADRTSDLPHMLPAPDAFASAVGALGLANDDTVVVYDDQGIFSAPRVWWTFRAMGHERVFVLDGGLKKWRAEDRPVAQRPPAPEPAHYRAELRPALCRSADDVRAAIDTGAPQIVDARPADRFAGRAPEPRAGLVGGAMPGARNTPASALVNDNGTLKSAAALETIFRRAGVDPARPAIAVCGSGVTAAIIALALETLGRDDWSLYDGSWAEWGKEEHDRAAYPVVNR